MTIDRFAALAQLLRLRSGPTTEAVRMHMTQGMSVPDAARSAGADYRLAIKAVYRARQGLELARMAVG